MKKLLVFVTLVSLTFAFASCSAPKGLKFQAIQDLSIQKDKKYPFLVYVKFYNPNKFPLHVKYGNIESFIEDLPLGEVKIDDDIKVRGHQTYMLPLGYSPDYNRMFPNPKTLKQPELNIKIDGSVAVEHKGKFYVTGIHFQGDIPQTK